MKQIKQAENWSEKRTQKLDSTWTAAVQKTIDKTSEALSDEAAAKARIKASMMRLAEGWFEKQENIDFYTHMAKAFIEDKDSRPNRLARYYEYVTKH